MSNVDRFLREEVVIFIPRDYKKEHLEALQCIIDIANGRDVRFRKSRNGGTRGRTILEFCEEKGRQRMDICINYNEDNYLYWCDPEWYKERGYEIIQIEDILYGSANKLSESDFENVFETG